MFSPRGFMKKFQKSKTGATNVGKKKIKIMKGNIKYDSDESVREALLEIVIYIIFLVTITTVVNAAQHLYMFYFNQTLERSFLDRNIETELGTEFTFHDLITTADWWLYMERVFLNNLHGISYNQNMKYYHNKNKSEELKSLKNGGGSGDGNLRERSGEEDKNIIDMENISDSSIYLSDNILLGPPRLRQIRVKEKSCEVHDIFLSYFTKCFAGYNKHIENNTGPYMNSKFYTMSELQVFPIRGEIKKYYGAGYVVDLSYNFEKNKQIFEDLKRNKWINRGTRLVILEFVLFNINTNIFNNVKMLAEVPPVGGIVPSHDFRTIRLHTFWTEGNWFLYMCGIIFYLMVLFYTIQEVVQFSRTGAKLYFTSMWNFLDILVLIFSYLSLVYNLIHPWYMSDILKKAKNNPQKMVSIDQICYWNLLYIDMMGVCVFLVWIKIFKYIGFNKTMLQFSTTLKRCAKDLFVFAVMFFIVFLAYAQLGLLIFGSSHPDFREFTISVITLMRMFLGDFEYQLIEEANHILGPIYFLTYVLFVFFILLNMFLAIINDTYGAVKSEVLMGRSNFGSYLKGLFQKSLMMCFPKRKFKSVLKRNKILQEILETSDSLPAFNLDAKNYDEGSPGRIRKRTSEILREYFEELSEFQQTPGPPKDNLEIQSLSKRIILLEEVFEELINNMDRILKKVESKKFKKNN
ncbi:polycystic kidney disease 2 [Cochliomyia hominivorax]